MSIVDRLYSGASCLRPVYHKNRKVSMRIDEELKGEIQTSLLNAML